MIIICEKWGQLGNRMFIFAHFVANALEYNYKVFNPAFDEYAEFFQSWSNNIYISYPNINRSFSIMPKNIRHVLRKSIYTVCSKISSLLIKMNFRKSFIHEIVSLNDENGEYNLNDEVFLNLIGSKKIIFVKGWLFRDKVNFSKHSAEIKNLFAPESTHENNVNALINSIRDNCDFIIGIHIRHGDYKTYQDGKYYYSYEKYGKIMENIVALFPGKRIHFLICSNEKITGTIFDKFEFTCGTNHFIEDMYALAKCDFIAGPPSTYTTWASFYGNVPLYVIQDTDIPIAIQYFNIIT